MPKSKPMKKSFFFVTHTQRFTSHSAPQSDFVVDDSVSGMDYLCSRSSDRIIVSDSKTHTESDAVMLLIGDVSKEDFEKSIQPKTPENAENQNSVKNWNDFRERMRKIENLMNNVTFRSMVLEATRKQQIDNLTQGENVPPVATRVRQIIVPSIDGEIIASPLHPLTLSFFAGEIFALQKNISFYLEKKKRKPGEAWIPFPVRLNETNKYLENVQNTGISTAGKNMARMKNFPPSVASYREAAKFAHPLSLPLQHAAIDGVLKAVLYRHAYVERMGGACGNGDAATGKQSNRKVVDLFAERCEYLVRAMAYRLRQRRQEYLKSEYPILIRSWPEFLRQFMNGGESTEALRSFFVDSAVQMVAYAADRRGKPVPLFDTDKRLLRESIARILQEKEVF